MNYSKLINYRNYILGFCFKILPIKQNRFYFNSFNGLYSDSPKRISEQLHNYYPNAEYYWEISEKSSEQLPQYIKPIKPYTVKTIYLKFTSRLLVDNFWGAFSRFLGEISEGSLKYKLISAYSRTGQLIIGTWHGTTIKKIATDEPCNVGKNIALYTNTNYLTCESEHMRKILQRISFGKIPILMTGYPRNDILFMDDEQEKNEIRKKLKLPQKKKVLLFAPTFRNDDIKMSGLFQITHLQIEKLLDTFGQQFGGEWIFVFRVHDNVIVAMKDYSICSEIVLSGNLGDDMAEYLAITDALLTDYSSCMFDFSLTKKPCFLYCPDLDYYMNVERGFYLNINELPFSVAVTAEELYYNVSKFSYKEYYKKLEAFKGVIGNVDDGHATKKIVNLIVENLSKDNI